MAKHLKFEGIELNSCSLNEFIGKLEQKGFILESEPSGLDIKLAFLRGDYGNYDGICEITLVANDYSGVYTVMVSGEEHYSVDDVLDDFEFFKGVAESYNIELVNEEDDYFDENDIDSIRDESLNKRVIYKRESDGSGVIVSIMAKEDDNVFYVHMTIIDNLMDDGVTKTKKACKDMTEHLSDRLAQCYSEHLAFNGIEMDGSIENFVEELEGKGFRSDMRPQWVDEQELATMHGQFLGEPCNLVLTSNNIGDITIVFVKRKERKSFDVVKDEFYKMLNIYMQKYGEPDQKEETLIGVPDSISALKNKEGTLAAFFKVGSEGSSVSIIVSIEEDSRFPYLALVYSDGINQGINNTDGEYDDLDEDFDINDINADNYYDDI